jgi:ketosteroid isomerase-like protein
VHPNEEQIRRFYSAFMRHDTAAMAAHYAPDAVFTDPAFGELRGPQVGAMWAMLTSRATDLVVEMMSSDADAAAGSGRWEAWYTFTATGRPVHNVVHTTFRFRDGLIVEQHDHFAFWPWSRQALGRAGLLLGWTPFLRRKVRHNARKSLDAFMAGRGAAASA